MFEKSCPTNKTSNTYNNFPPNLPKYLKRIYKNIIQFFLNTRKIVNFSNFKINHIIHFVVIHDKNKNNISTNFTFAPVNRQVLLYSPSKNCQHAVFSPRIFLIRDNLLFVFISLINSFHPQTHILRKTIIHRIFQPGMYSQILSAMYYS